MTQEEKRILLVDLCARQPYHTYVLVDYIDEYNVYEILNAYHIIGLKHYTGDDGLINIKPYLRPMSSMSEKEKNIYEYNRNSNVEVVRMALFDWLNEHHFDYRGLIPMGLALEAPEDMYK